MDTQTVAALPAPVNPVPQSTPSGATFHIAALSRDARRAYCQLTGTSCAVWVDYDADIGMLLEQPRFQHPRAISSETLTLIVQQYDRNVRLASHHQCAYPANGAEAAAARAELERRAAGLSALERLAQYVTTHANRDQTVTHPRLVLEIPIPTALEIVGGCLMLEVKGFRTGVDEVSAVHWLEVLGVTR